MVELRDDDHESSRPSNCCRDFASDFGASLRNTSVTASVDLAFPRYGEGEPWCRNISVARASIRSQGLFGLSVWPGGQFPVSGSSVWRPRSLVAVATRRRVEMEFSLRRRWVIGGHSALQSSRPLCPRTGHSAFKVGNSRIGTE